MHAVFEGMSLPEHAHNMWLYTLLPRVCTELAVLDPFPGDLVVLIKEGVSAVTDSILGSMDLPMTVEEAEEATEQAAAA